MSKLQSLSPEKLADIKRLVLAGTGPKKISDDLGVSISVVHKYKAQWKDEGLEFASIRGQRSATTSESSANQSRPSGAIAATGKTITQNRKQTNTTNPQSVSIKGHSNFIINGTSIHISSSAKSVIIDRNDKDQTLIMRIDI